NGVIRIVVHIENGSKQKIKTESAQLTGRNEARNIGQPRISALTESHHARKVGYALADSNDAAAFLIDADKKRNARMRKRHLLQIGVQFFHLGGATDVRGKKDNTTGMIALDDVFNGRRGRFAVQTDMDDLPDLLFER